MKKYIFFLVAFMIAFFLQTLSGATIYSTVTGGQWHYASTWIGGIIPDDQDSVIIQGPVIVGYVDNTGVHNSHAGWVNITAEGSLKPNEYGGGTVIFFLYVTNFIENHGTIDNTYQILKIQVSGDISNSGYWGPVETIIDGENNHNISLSTGEVFHGNWTVSGGNLTALTDLYFDGNYNFNASFFTNGVFNLNGAVLHMGNHGINTNGTVIFNGVLEGDFEILGTFNVDKEPADTLVFQGTVHITDTLQNSLWGGGYCIFVLKIEGDIINNGVVRDNPENDHLKLMINGNITNNGEWSCNFVTLSGSQTQNISQSPGKSFVSDFFDADSTSAIEAQSDIEILQNFNLNRSLLQMNGHTLSMASRLTNGYITNAKLAGATLQNITSLDSLTITGKVSCEDDVIFQNNIVVEDTLQSEIYGGGVIYYDLLVQGDITNNGVIRNITQSNFLRIYVTGNITNNGEWTCNSVTFSGSQTQNISQSPGKSFVSDFFDADSTSAIEAQSDIEILQNFNLNRSLLQMNGHTLSMASRLTNGYITNAKLAGATLQNITSLDSLTITGKVSCEDDVIFQNNIVVEDTLQSEIYGGGVIYYDLLVQGDITNNGVIRNITQSNFLRIYITGNITNNGIWINKLTQLQGSEDQYITLSESKPVEGVVEFDAGLSTSPFQWYYNDEILESDDFTGETSQILTWDVPLDAPWFGTFYCETGEGTSRNIIVGQMLFPPSGLQTTVNCTDVELNWEMPQGTPDGWNVYRDGESLAFVTETNYADTMLLPEQDYSYFVTAVYADMESQPSNTGYVTVPLPENIIPEKFSVTVSDSTAFCNWEKPDGCIAPEGYNIYRNNLKLNTLPIFETGFEDVPGEGSFDYFVTAVYYFGESLPSDTVNVQIAGIAEDLQNAGIEVFPNPATTYLNIKTEGEPCKLFLLDELGNVIKTGTVNNTGLKLNVSQIKSGMYVLLFKMQKGYVKTKVILR